uniref:mRNA 5'-phosphatase n=1 Tax=Mantoniella tinhauana virus 1 TaxID=3111543 RepID=A0AB38ZMA7_9VIRU
MARYNNDMDLFDVIHPVIDAHKDEGDIEIEFRFGKHNGKLFDTNVGKDVWSRVLKGLKKYDGWERVDESTSEVYYNDSSNVRITRNTDTGEQKMIQKISVVKKDFKREPLDVRFCVSREIPTSGEYDMDRVRTKTRYSFVRKNLSIDMTISTGDNLDRDSEDEASYQIELEIINPTKIENLKNILQKITDVSKLIPC